MTGYVERESENLNPSGPTDTAEFRGEQVRGNEHRPPGPLVQKRAKRTYAV